MSIDQSTAARVAKLARIKVRRGALPALGRRIQHHSGFIEQIE